MNRAFLASAFAISLIAVGCSKKQAAAPTPPPAPAPSAAQAANPRSTPPQQRASATPAPSRTETTRPRTPDAATRKRIDELLARIEDAYFDYNQSSLRPDALKALQADSTELRDIIVQYPDYKLTVEGHCDERGSAEYNLALGDRRAQAAKDYLVGVGIPSAQLSVISYGKDHPVCEEHDEACWQKNRRIHIVAMAK
jgi:peptidoglycan-associated lipoprotein